MVREDDTYAPLIGGPASKKRSWDDEYVLKRQFSALIPAFDPRPGRTNVNQTTDVEVRKIRVSFESIQFVCTDIDSLSIIF